MFFLKKVKILRFIFQQLLVALFKYTTNLPMIEEQNGGI